MDIQVGQQVKLHKHWLRDGQPGTVVEVDTDSDRCLVQFSRSYLGGGIDGNSLWLEEKDFILVAPSLTKPKKRGKVISC